MDLVLVNGREREEKRVVERMGNREQEDEKECKKENVILSGEQGKEEEKIIEYLRTRGEETGT